MHHDSFHITWPCEIKKHLNKHGYEVKELSSLEGLGEGDTVIVLVKGAVLRQEWHWMSLPDDRKGWIEAYFGENTEIVKIYLIKKN